MPIRDLAVALAVLVLIPIILKRPYVGILAWAWLSYMNPHRLGWGFAREAPFAMLIAVVTLMSMIFMKDRIRIPWTRESVLLLIFVLWMVLTTAFSLQFDYSIVQLEKVVKIQIMTFATLALITSRDRLIQLVWVIVISLGLYGVKGGIFTLATGGAYHVRGPLGTFIGGNNEIGLALIMTLPLMRYLQLQMKKKWQSYLFVFAMGTTVIAILGTQSRGALVGLLVMTIMLVLKSRRRFVIVFLIALMTPVAFKVMPEAWFDRMQSIQEYEQDASALGRINAWWMAFHMAKDRPLVGGGFEAFHWRNFHKYAPEPNRVHDAHSIYFEVMGEHGMAGLLIYLMLGIYSWRSGSWVIATTRTRKDMQWARDLASMIQVSMVGYASAGAFLGLAYFDFYYHLVAMMVIMKVLVRKRLREEMETSDHGHEGDAAGSEAFQGSRRGRRRLAHRAS